MAGENNLVVIWEWMDDPFRWIPYDSCVCHALETALANDVTTVHLGDVDVSLYNYSVNLEKLYQRRHGIGTRREVRRRLYEEQSCPGNGMCWQWQGDLPSHWLLYEVKIQSALETAFERGDKTIDLERIDKRYCYIVDLVTMSQTRKQTGYRRAIRRDQAKPYPLASNKTHPSKEHPVSSSSSGEESEDGVAAQQKAGNSKQGIFRVLSGLVKSGNKKSGKKESVGTSNTAKSSSGASVTTPEATTTRADEMFQKFTKEATEAQSTEDCCICFASLKSASHYDDDDSTSIQLVRCSHALHRSCLRAMFKSSAQEGYIQCPICKTIYGEKTGNQPNGTMTHSVENFTLPGFPGCKTICIIYTIRGGIQGPEHPRPGASYTARGFPRCCYLPDNEKGRMVLGLLKIAWKRRLIFTIGTSTTTGETSTVTWNEIHHKTEYSSNYSGHGYPDPNYLDNVLVELSLHGVYES